MARAYVDGLRRSVEKFVKEQFAPFEITAVEIYEDAERDSFPILDIVVFSTGPLLTWPAESLPASFRNYGSFLPSKVNMHSVSQLSADALAGSVKLERTIASDCSVSY